MSTRKRGRPPGIRNYTEFNEPTRWTEDLISHIDEIASPKQINAAKNYARSGRVMELSVSPGVIEACVQGRNKTPYSVRLLSFRPDEGTLEGILSKLCEKAIYKSALLMGELPAELEEIFHSSGVTLSIKRFNWNQQMCTCSEPGNMCKHILAVVYVAALAFDHDPFLLLKFKGLDKNLLMETLCAPVGGALSPRICPGGTPDDKYRAINDDPEEPPARTDAAFYGTSELAAALGANTAPQLESGHPMPLLDFPLWRGEISYANSIAPYYKTVKKFIENGEG
jgi:uncharacterized Zn finger protein